MRELAILLLAVLAVMEGFKIHNQYAAINELRAVIAANTVHSDPPRTSNWLQDRLNQPDHPLDTAPYHQQQAVTGTVPASNYWVDKNGMAHH